MQQIYTAEQLRIKQPTASNVTYVNIIHTKQANRASIENSEVPKMYSENVANLSTTRRGQVGDARGSRRRIYVEVTTNLLPTDVTKIVLTEFELYDGR